MIFLVDISKYLKNKDWKKGWINDYYMRFIMRIAAEFVAQKLGTIEKIVFLADKRYELKTDAFKYLMSRKFTVERELILAREFILYSESNRNTLLKEINKYDVFVFHRFAGTWIKDVYKEIRNLNFYASNDRFLYTSSFPLYKINNIEKYFEITENLEEINKFGLKEKTLIEEEGNYYVSSELYEIYNAWNLGKNKEFLNKAVKYFISTSLGIIDHLTSERIKSIKSYSSVDILLLSRDQFLRRRISRYLANQKRGAIEYDLRDGFPYLSNKIKKCEIFVFRNLEFLSYQQQNRLYQIVTAFGSQKKFFIFEAQSPDALSFGLRNKFLQIEVEPAIKYAELKTHLLFFIMKQHVNFREEKEWFLTLYKYVRDNKFSSLLSNIDDFYAVDIVIERTEIFVNLEDLISPVNWYIFYKGYEKFISTDFELPKKNCGYYIKYVGDFWEISFDYTEPLLLENRIGYYYIAYMMKKEGKELSATNVRKKITPGKIIPAADEEKNVQVIRKAITDAIAHIKEKENDLNLGNKFSLFLTETFFPNRLITRKKEKTSEEYFKDKFDKCSCKFPPNMDFKWEFIDSPKLN